jgi:biotin operon repressor
MRRADRLLDLVARLKAKPLARADDLAQAMEPSVRTIYRDIAALQAHGLPIEGQAGVGYVLRGEITLPPLVFNHDQLEALALGLAYVEHVGDPDLATAAHEARAKVDAAWAGQPTPPPFKRRLRAWQPTEHRAPAFAAPAAGGAASAEDGHVRLSRCPSGAHAALRSAPRAYSVFERMAAYFLVSRSRRFPSIQAGSDETRRLRER